MFNRGNQVKMKCDGCPYDMGIRGPLGGYKILGWTHPSGANMASQPPANIDFFK